MEEEEVEDMVGEDAYNPPISTMEKQATWHGSVPSHAHCVYISMTHTMSWRISHSCFQNGNKIRGTIKW